jgi:hypothetical protein
MSEQDHITLKWGTLKAWHLHSEKGQQLLRKYHELGASFSAAMQKDTPEQKSLLCQMIDECNAPTIYLDWDGVDVSKEEAKRYVLEYGTDAEKRRRAQPVTHA